MFSYISLFAGDAVSSSPAATTGSPTDASITNVSRPLVQDETVEDESRAMDIATAAGDSVVQVLPSSSSTVSVAPKDVSNHDNLLVDIDPGKLWPQLLSLVNESVS